VHFYTVLTNDIFERTDLKIRGMKMTRFFVDIEHRVVLVTSVSNFLGSNLIENLKRNVWKFVKRFLFVVII
jgi:hypothetical protein